MPNFSFTWIANFRDGSILSQFDPITGQEIRFKDVQDKFESLQKFSLVNTFQTLTVTVDLEQAVIIINKTQVVESDFGKNRNNVRLIYFRRNRLVYGNNLNTVLKHEIIYFIGYQYNDEVGQNHKLLFQIDAEGNIVVGA